MKVVHVSPSAGLKCGIATFAAKLNPYLSDINETVLSNKVTSVYENDADILLLEFEYGLHDKVDWSSILSFPGKKYIIQHAYSPTKKYEQLNNLIFSNFDKIIFLTKRCKIEAGKQRPEHLHKIKVLPHYAEKLIGTPRVGFDHNKIRIGIHGFGFPRNGFMKLLNCQHLSDKHRVYIQATINTFDNIAEKETSNYVDKIRRKMWDINETHACEIVKLDFNYRETKEEIIEALRENCDVLVHAQNSGLPNYYNTSGSVNVLLAAGLPVFTIAEYHTEMIPSNAINRISHPNDIFTGNYKLTSTEEGILEYHSKNSPSEFAKNLYRMLDED